MAAVNYLLGLTRGINLYDEGLAVLSAARILGGEIPYRDYWMLYAPGQFYLLAGLFKAFGPSLLVERVASAVVLCALSAVVYLLARRVAPQPWALAAWALWITRTGDLRGFFGSAIPAALLLGLLSALGVMASLRDGRRGRLIWSGAAAGGAMLFRQDLGAYTLVAGLALLLACALIGPPQGDAPARAGRMLQAPALYLAGAAILVVPVFAFFAGRASTGVVTEDLFVIPLTIFPQVRGAAAPSFLTNPLGAFAFYFPLLGLAAAAPVLAFRARDSAVETWRVGFLILLCGLYLGNALVRSDVAHMIPALAPAVALFGWLGARASGRRGGPAALVVVAAAGLALALPPLFARVADALDTASSRAMVRLDVARGRGITLDERLRDYPAAIRFIQAETQPGEKIFVGLGRHDRIFANDAMFYFLADRPSATRYHDLHPGLATTRAVQEGIIREIEAGGVRYVVLRHDRPPAADNADLSGEDRALDRFIRARFEPVAVFPPYTVWRRRQ